MHVPKGIEEPVPEPESEMKTRLGCRSFPAQAADLHRIRSYIREEGARANVPEPMLGDIVVAVSEACTNSALHSTSAEVKVRWEMVGDRIEVAIEDQGVFTPRIPFPGIDTRGGGRGIAVMMALMDEVTIQEGNDDAPGTVVRLVKYAA